MSALHDASAAYYFSNCPVVGTTLTGAMNCGYPDDKWGWAAGVGGIFNLPFIAKGDTIAFQVNYAKGAARYINRRDRPTVGPTPRRSVGLTRSASALPRTPSCATTFRACSPAGSS